MNSNSVSDFWTLVAAVFVVIITVLAIGLVIFLRFWPAKQASDLPGKRLSAIVAIGIIFFLDIVVIGLFFLFDNFSRPSFLALTIILLVGGIIGVFQALRLYTFQIAFIKLHEAAKKSKGHPSKSN